MNKTSDIKVGMIGLGYAGFPMACLLSRKFPVTGFDLSEERVKELNSGYDRCGDVDKKELENMLKKGVTFTNEIEKLRDCNFYVVVVPTPIDENNHPDVECIVSASREVGTVISRGDIVVYESTVHPGATEEICVPEIEAVSGLKFNEDFFVGYSPERINPGDKVHTVENTVKITSGSTHEAAELIDNVYQSVLGQRNTWKASSIKVAEAAKVVENSQRDINIAFINEVAKVLNSMNIDTNEVVDAMDTKWNALHFRPGLVGGHCISVDPYYLIERAEEHGVDAVLMKTGRMINNSMADYVVKHCIDLLAAKGKHIPSSRVLLLGFTFKENCPDVRNTKVNDIYKGFRQHTDNVDVFDPWADAVLVKRAYGIDLFTEANQINSQYDAVVLCVAHKNILNLDVIPQWKTADGFIFDVKGKLPRNVADYRL